MPELPQNLPAFIDPAGGLQPGLCRSCQQPIYWAKTVKGKSHPLNLDGQSHFGSCPHAKTWSKGGKG